MSKKNPARELPMGDVFTATAPQYGAPRPRAARVEFRTRSEFNARVAENFLRITAAEAAAKYGWVWKYDYIMLSDTEASDSDAAIAALCEREPCWEMVSVTRGFAVGYVATRQYTTNAYGEWQELE